jgi:hypothetical protein
MLPENQECLFTVSPEDLELMGFLLCLPLVDHMHKVMCEYKWDTLSTKTKLLFEMTQDMTKINMKQLKE